MNTPENRRILLVDDTPAIHEDFRKILAPVVACTGLDEVESALFGAVAAAPVLGFDLDSAYQGEEGLAKVRAARQSGLPYALAFVDMRMPPGWDGVQTIERLWQDDPLLQIVICTAYADYSWDEVLARLDVGDRLLILKKPFDAIEVCQLASALCAKWRMTQQAALKMAGLEAAVQARTAELRLANEALQAEMAERKHLESQLVQAEKLASIGQLAAGVAHEINNPIGFILSNVGALDGYHQALWAMLAAHEEALSAIAAPEIAARLDRLGKTLALDLCKEDMPVLMRETREGIVRVRQIVSDLRDFARVDASQDWQWANLHLGIDSTLAIANGEIAPRADVVKEYGVLPEVECLPAQINQVLLNLLVNAAHAIAGERGRITIRTGADDERVWIEVADTGGGIASENLSRIFDPFFTTKPVGQGRGLGLSLSYGIVQKHRGCIDVSSEIGKGSRFRVVLPVRQLAKV
jgi:two-component system NtrC family sensor kinase